MDLRSAYNLVCICEGDKWKMAFNIMSGHYEYCVIPYGLSCMASVFQCLINDILRDMIGKFIIAYSNEILIYSPDLNSHKAHIKEVLSKLLNNHLFVKAAKCEFHITQISLLGYIISVQGVPMDKDKVSAVTTWPTPITIKELQCFLGFTNFYRRSIRGFSSIAIPLMTLNEGS